MFFWPAFAILILFQLSNCLPTSNSYHVERNDPTADFSSAFANTLNATWQTFWSNPESSFSEHPLICSDKSFAYPSIWDLAVTGKAVTFSKDDNGISKVTANCLQYKNPQGWFSASTAKNNDVYVDDNAQVMWVYLESYKNTQNDEHLQIAQTLMSLIQGQWVQSTGGVRWKLGAPYVASISTTEAALSAARMYEFNRDPNLLSFAQQCTDWIFDNLQDPDDGLIYDGLDSSNGNVNKGKLTYTVGTMLSTLSLLNKYSANPKYLRKAIDLSNSALNPKGAFYNSDGYWNNPVSYEHLFFTGLTDLLKSSSSYAKYMYSSTFNRIQSEVIRQGNYIYYTGQTSESGNYLANTGKYSPDVESSTSSTKFNLTHLLANVIPNFQNSKRVESSAVCAQRNSFSLMNNAAASQIYYQVDRLTSN